MSEEHAMVPGQPVNPVVREATNTVTRGCRCMFGREANAFRTITGTIIRLLAQRDYREFIPSTLAPQGVFVDKAGPEVLGQMYAFTDKGHRELCLIPEVTAICQRLYKDEWSKSMRKPVKLFYLTRCYRYERPQKGRYREFWQLGVECMGGEPTSHDDRQEMIDLLRTCLAAVNLEGFVINDGVKRGLDYYTEDGFEVEVSRLGAQKQVAGGGRYDCGIGWAIGVDRLMLGVYGDEILGAKS